MFQGWILLQRASRGTMTNQSERATLAVAICTYNRNRSLSNLLDALIVSVERVNNRAAIGVVIVDDSVDGKARDVVDRFEERFELGIHYRVSGRQNISIARNIAINTASEMADWVAMTDDDCEPSPEWLEALLDIQHRTGADAVMGPMVRRAPPGSPTWITEQPFLEVGVEHSVEDGAIVATAATHNSMISSRWLREHPTMRFQPQMGVIGGEDMIFYRAAYAVGLRIRYSQHAIVYENQPLSRMTLKFQLYSFFWHGNSSYITNVRSGITPGRMFIHGVNLLQQACARSVIRAFRGQRPQLRYCLASVLQAVGMLLGFLGIRIHHH
jgi:succinoglycan biosynthesis protein ExoM